ncbi:MAG TPA: GNAT family N-acetyltransferase [Amycolatopsis sp.]|nr:GNAT family N-acetyltransferase [Amycolatopsis sp.]
MVEFADIVTPVPREIWATVFPRDPYALETQSPEWTDAMCAAGGYRDVSRLYETVDGRALVLPLLRRSWIPAASVDASNPRHCGAGGLLGSGGVSAGEIAAVLDDLSARPALARSVWPGPLELAAWRAAAPPGALTVAHRAHLLDLGAGWEGVWAGEFRGTARRKVRRAEEAGVTVDCGTGGELVPELYRLMALAARRWARRQHEPLWLTIRRLRYRDPPRKFEAIGRFLGERFRVYLARVGGRPVAAVALLQGTNAYYFRGALDERHSGNANYLLHCRAIQAACAGGCRYYYLGDSGWSAGLAQFKEAFGARACDYPEYRFERFPVSKVEHEVKQIVKRAIGFRD